jgi:hypothetical protein
VHDRKAIQRIARAANKEKPKSTKAFYRAIRDQCAKEDRAKPGDTLLKQLALPLYKRPKA